MKLKNCALTLAAMAALLPAAGCSLLQKPTAQITGARLGQAGLTEATMVFDVKVDNPYTVALPLANVDYALASEGQRFLAGEADVAGEIPANSSKVLNVPVRISYLELINAVKGARPGATIQIGRAHV